MPVSNQVVIQALRQWHNVAITEQTVERILRYIRERDEGLYALIDSSERGLGLHERESFLDSIGYLIVGRSWPRFHEGQRVLAGFVRQLYTRGPAHGVRLGMEWRQLALQAERTLAKHRLNHL